MDNQLWKGVLIEESLNTSQIIPQIRIISTRVTTLEEQVEKGEFHFHSVEVGEENVDTVVSFISQNIKDSWYFHLVRNGEMIVIFHDKAFKAKKEHQNEIDKIREYALSQGIIAEQLPLEKLFDDPYL